MGNESVQEGLRNSVETAVGSADQWSPEVLIFAGVMGLGAVSLLVGVVWAVAHTLSK